MANNIFQLDIYLHSEEAEKEKDKQSLTETTTGEESEGKSKKKSSKEDKDALAKNKKAAKQAAFYIAEIVQTTKHVASQEINFRISRHATMYGNQARANQLSNEMQTFKSVTSYGAGIASGFAMGGPIGGAIAIATSALMIAQDVSQNIQKYEDKQEDHLLNSAYAQERLGMITASKGR